MVTKRFKTQETEEKNISTESLYFERYSNSMCKQTNAHLLNLLIHTVAVMTYKTTFKKENVSMLK